MRDPTTLTDTNPGNFQTTRKSRVGGSATLVHRRVGCSAAILVCRKMGRSSAEGETVTKISTVWGALQWVAPGRPLRGSSPCVLQLNGC
eukprot:1154466-Pelagomonas_calceolata.AAC.3